jgi:hypothetical protein
MEQTVTKENNKYLEDFESLNFFEKQKILSAPADINFLDNEVESNESE